VTEDALRGAVDKTRSLRQQIEGQLADGGRGEVVREGVRIAILGPPNAGKSTLLNALAERPAAIVSPLAGTTRDVVQVSLQLGGLPVMLSDTAGLREATDDQIEVQGMLRAAEEARRAQLQLWVYDAGDAPTHAEQLDADAVVDALKGESAKSAARDLEEAVDAVPKLLVLNKMDLHPGTPTSPLVPEALQWRLSCETGEGVQSFLDALAEIVSAKYGSADGEAALITRTRHRQHLRACSDALLAFEEYAALGDGAPLDLAAEEIRLAANELGRITGTIDVEEMLDVIFRDFCIGK
jgi:tRNA modification GTPase